MSHMTWPPKLVRTDVLGEVKDASGRSFPRDIGRACWLGGNCYYAFGDTFCHDKHGDFKGVTNNTAAYVPDPVGKPTVSQYLDAEHNAKVNAYVPFTQDEHQFDERPDNKKENTRMTCWSFGGIIEDREGSGQGWVFFDKMITHGGQGGHHYGMGVCRASVQPDKSIKMDRVIGDNVVFGEDEPRFGSISYLIDEDGWVYLLGAKDPDPSKFDMRCHLARIRRDADFTKRENYEFFKNSMDFKGEWGRSYNSSGDLAQLQDLDGQAQGALIKVPNFAPEGKPYMWIGVNKFMAGHMYVGCAPKVTGPWEVKDLGPLPEDPHPPQTQKKGPKYALYPNPKASDMAKGEMLCTWTDATQMGGKVLAARFYFEGQFDSPPVPHAQAEEKHGGFRDSIKEKIGGFLHK